MFGPLSLMLLFATPVKLAAPGFVSVNVDPRLSELFLDRFIVLAKNPDLTVVTARDISLVLGLERQRELLGCTGSSSSCIVELAGALGADAVLSGTVAKTEKSVTLVLRAIRANDASELVSATVRAGSEDELQEWIEEHARGFARQLVARVRGEPEPTGFPAWPKWAALAGGVAVGGTGAVLRGLAEAQANTLKGASIQKPVDVDSTASNGRTFEASGNVMICVGAALLATGAVLFANSPGSSQVALVPVQGGGGVVVQGRF